VREAGPTIPLLRKPSHNISEVGSGKPHDPEKQRLAEIIDRLNDIY